MTTDITKECDEIYMILVGRADGSTLQKGSFLITVDHRRYEVSACSDAADSEYAPGVDGKWAFDNEDALTARLVELQTNPDLIPELREWLKAMEVY